MSWRAMLSAAAVGLLVGGAIGYTLHGKPAPSPSVKVAVQASRAAHAAAAKIDTVYLAQRAAEQRTRVQYDTTHDTITVVRDSVRTVYVEKAVADREIRACTEVLNTCDARHAADSVEKARLHDEIAAREAQMPARLQVSAAALYDPIARTPSARAEADVRITTHLSALADAERGIGVTDSLRVHVGARWTF